MTQPLSLAQIVELSSAYYQSAVLFAALQLDLFSLVQRHVDSTGIGIDAQQLAAQKSTSERGMRLLLDGCVACGLLHKNSALYTNTNAGKMALVRGAPHDLTGAIRYNHDVYDAWGKLAELAKTGKPVEDPQTHLGDDPQRTRRFALAMHARALGIGKAVIPMLSFAPKSRVLDLAGGPGTYAMLMAQANPDLTCETRDLPAICAVATEIVGASDVADRVTCRAGDYHVDEYAPRTFDAVTIFGALHQESSEQIVQILKRAYDALVPGGVIYVLDMMTDATHTKPTFSALFAINMALTTHHGWVFSDEELHEWLCEVGFDGCTTQPVSPPMPHWLVSARKPG